MQSIKNNNNQQLFHAGTKIDENERILNVGGRVFNSTVKSTSLKKARTIAINLLKRIKWSNKYYRKDIGYKIID